MDIITNDDLKKWPYLYRVELLSIYAEVGLLIGSNVSKAAEPLVDQSLVGRFMGQRRIKIKRESSPTE